MNKFISDLLTDSLKARLHRRFLSRNSMQFLSCWSCNFNIARVNQLRFQRDFRAIYRAITCDLSPRFTKHGNFEQQFRYSAGAHVLFWFDFFFILFPFASISFVLFQFCFVSFYNSAKTSNWTGVTELEWLQFSSPKRKKIFSYLKSYDREVLQNLTVLPLDNSLVGLQLGKDLDKCK